MLVKKHTGLTESQVLESENKYGKNVLSPPQETSFLKELWKTFKSDSLIKILSVALAITFALAIFGLADWLETVGIAIAVILATTVSTYSEYSNNKLFQKLQDEYSKIICKIYRKKNDVTHVTDINIEDIVTGDLVLLQAGDKVPADGIIIDGSVKVNQASLNGESDECKKVATDDETVFNADDVDFLHENCIFRGSVVTSGEAVMKVMAVGDKSQFGKLAKELNTEEKTISPLKAKLSKLANIISKFAYVGAVVIAIANFIFQFMQFDSGFSAYFTAANAGTIATDAVQSIILAIVIIVVAVPEGLPMMIALVSGLNMKKLLKDNILIRTIDGAETAGSLNILFSDKTGTITKGELQVSSFYDANINEYKSPNELSNPIRSLFQTAVKQNSSAIANIADGKLEIVGGNATEKALHGFFGTDIIDEKPYEKVDMLPFNSKNKYSIVTLKDAGETVSFIKGAPERLFDHCTKFFDENGNEQEFTSDMKNKMQAHMDMLATRAMRVLAFAVSRKPIGDDVFSDITFIGIVGIRDELRPEAISAIKTAHRAGIQVVMVTGDKKETAFAISKDAGLVTSDDDVVITSSDMSAMSDDELKAIIPNLRVVARALPTDKSRLVRVCQELGLVVGMTGDGVNDAPALKKADVGFAMGSGTEVAKEAADITILDNNFNSVVKTVLYGRTIYNNIRKFIVFQLTINMSAVLISFIGPFIGLDHPLTVTQMLWVNIVMDTLAALAFGTEPALDRYMDEKPKRRDESIVSGLMLAKVITVGAYLTIASLLFLKLPIIANLFRTVPEGAVTILGTGFFAFYVLSAMLNGFNSRTDKINIFDNITKNKNFFAIIGLIVVVQVIMTYVGGKVLSTAGLNLYEWGVVIALALIIVPVGMLAKAIFNPIFNKNNVLHKNILRKSK